ncbi:hypothetical protein BDV96DRAFT_504994 [Lophiotrema nucula]|uniref:Uncharacterized protein n=1 Tax=Lophiotrema nucula TaxID=690887 RepID=A0A6A5YQ29_9PLEO|nr:hypothetical protein BDV96DRAFT_504994 [Lophiotrema nucula]
MKAGKEVSIDTKALPPLPSPWLLLPTSILETLSARFPSQASFEDSCIPLHITRNSNITSAVNRLKVYLGWCGKEREPTIQWPQALESDNRIIAVSAQGEGTSKLASIMEVAKRVVSEGDGEAVVWYSYTGLGSQAIIVDSAGKNENADNVMDDEEDLFETLNQAEEQEQEREPKQSPKIRKVPVLTVWMSKSQIPEFRGPFGEQMFKVGQMQEEG